jgi:hypothetical protein
MKEVLAQLQSNPLFQSWFARVAALVTFLLLVDGVLNLFNRGLHVTRRVWRWLVAVIGIPHTLTAIKQRLATLESVILRNETRTTPTEPQMEPHFGVYWKIDRVNKTVADTIFCSCCQPVNILEHSSRSDEWYCRKGSGYYKLRDLHGNRLTLYDAHKHVSQLYFGSNA